MGLSSSLVGQGQINLDYPFFAVWGVRHYYYNYF